MNRLPRKPLALSVAVLGLAVLAVTAVVCRERIVEQWYLHKLRSDVELALEFVRHPRDSAKHRALDRFVESDEGGRRVATLLVTTALRSLKVGPASDSLVGLIGLDYDRWQAQTKPVSVVYDVRSSGDSAIRIETVEEKEVGESLWKLLHLKALRRRSWAVDREVSIAIVPLGDAYVRFSPPRAGEPKLIAVSQIDVGRAPFVCVVTGTEWPQRFLER